jgi:hypothetical protein
VLSQRRAATLFGCSRRGRAPARRRSTVFVWDVITVILKAIAVGFVLLVVLGMTGYGMFS